jgi:hypothetical protein
MGKLPIEAYTAPAAYIAHCRSNTDRNCIQPYFGVELRGIGLFRNAKAWASLTSKGMEPSSVRAQRRISVGMREPTVLSEKNRSSSAKQCK